MKIINIPQGTPEWLAARAGKFTASKFSELLSKGRGNAPSITRFNYLVRVACEQQKKTPIVDNFGSEVQSFLTHGTETEPRARNAYQIATGNIVDEVGLIVHDDLPASCSPDGLIGSDGGLEIKCPVKHDRHLAAFDGMPAEHVAQVQGCLWLTGRKWWDFVSYHEGFPEQTQLIIHRILPDLAFHDRLETEIRRAVDELPDIITKITTMRGAA